MRTILPIILVVLCLAATLRVEGVWPPESVRLQVENVIERITKPGLALAALVDKYLSPGEPAGAPDGNARPAAMIRAVVDSHPPRESAEAECG